MGEVLLLSTPEIVQLNPEFWAVMDTALSKYLPSRWLLKQLEKFEHPFWVTRDTPSFGAEYMYLYQVWKGSLQWKGSYGADTISSKDDGGGVTDGQNETSIYPLNFVCDGNDKEL